MKIFLTIVIVWMGCSHAQTPIRNNYNQYAVYTPYNRYISECYGVPCPHGTTHCGTRSTTSADDKKLLTTIECKDYYGYVLGSAVKSITVPTFFGGVYSHGNGNNEIYGNSGSGGYYGDYYTHGNGDSENFGNRGSGGYYGQTHGDYYTHGNGDSENFGNRGREGYYGPTHGDYYMGGNVVREDKGSYGGGGNGNKGNLGESFLGGGYHANGDKKDESEPEKHDSSGSKGNVVYILVNSSQPLLNN